VFDSFEGLTEFSGPDGKAAKGRGRYRGSFQELLKFIRLYGLSDDIFLHRGLIEETLPRLLARDRSLSFSLVYIDTDLYTSTRTILRLLHPRMVKGGLFVLDEWNDPSYPGEGVAANEFLAEHGRWYEPQAPADTRQPTMVLRRIR